MRCNMRDNLAFLQPHCIELCAVIYPHLGLTFAVAPKFLGLDDSPSCCWQRADWQSCLRSVETSGLLVYISVRRRVVLQLQACQCTVQASLTDHRLSHTAAGSNALRCRCSCSKSKYTSICSAVSCVRCYWRLQLLQVRSNQQFCKTTAAFLSGFSFINRLLTDSRCICAGLEGNRKRGRVHGVMQFLTLPISVLSQR